MEKIVHVSSQLSIWPTRELFNRGAPVICIDARAAHKVLSAWLNKSDESDAVGLAQPVRTGWYGAEHAKSEASDQLRLVLSVRDRLIRARGRYQETSARPFEGPLDPACAGHAGYSRQNFRNQLGRPSKELQAWK